MGTGLKDIRICCFALAALLAAACLSSTIAAQTPAFGAAQAGPPPSSGGIFPLKDVHAGQTATAWTVFTGTKPEPMQVEILGVLRNERGPGHDLILAQLHGAKPEYTGVVAGMSGSPVYIGGKLVGSLSYRIGQFSKDPIAGITPIEQMLEVKDLPLQGAEGGDPSASLRASSGTEGQRDRGTEGPFDFAQGRLRDRGIRDQGAETNFQEMETPLVMSGFHPEAVKLWQEKVAGTGLEMVTAGGVGGSSIAGSGKAGSGKAGAADPAAIASIEPGSAVSALLVRGDLQIAATCTVTYVDPKQLLACGHPILQAGPVSLPMTTADVVATLASPLNEFKIVNTGAPIGAFTEDRDSAIRGVFGAQARMIPVHIDINGAGKPRKLNIDVLDMPSLTPQAVLVSLYESLLETNESTAETSYHVTGDVDVDGYPPAPVDVWASSGEALPASLMAALQAADRFNRLYANGARRGAIRDVNVNIEAVPRRVSVELESARLISANIVHPGDTVMLEATLRPWQQPERNVRIPLTLPARLEPGTLRVLVSDAGTLDRTLDQPRLVPRPMNMETALAEARSAHAADRIYVSLLVPETQAGMDGQTLSSLPISMANAFEPLRAAQDVTLNGESAQVSSSAPAGGVLTGFQVLSLRIEPGGGLN